MTLKNNGIGFFAYVQIRKLIIIFLISLPTLTYGNDSLKIENFTSANTKIILSRLHFSLQLEGSSFNISDPTWAHDWWLTRPFTTLVNPFSYSFLFPTLHMNPVSFSLSYNQKYFIKVRYLNFDENYEAQNELNGTHINSQPGYIDHRVYEISDAMVLYSPFNNNSLSPFKFGFGYSHRIGWESHNVIVIQNPYWGEILGQVESRNDKGYIIEIEYELTPFKKSKIFKHLITGLTANKRIFNHGYNMFSYGGTLGIWF